MRRYLLSEESDQSLLAIIISIKELVTDLLILINGQEIEYQSIIMHNDALRDDIHSIKNALQILQCLVMVTYDRYAVLEFIYVVCDVCWEVKSISSPETNPSSNLVHDELQKAYANSRRKMSSLSFKHITRRKFWRSRSRSNSENVRLLKDVITQSLEGLTRVQANSISDLKEDIEDLIQKLILFHPLFTWFDNLGAWRFIHCNLDLLCSQLVKLASIIYSCWVDNNMDKDDRVLLKSHLSDLLQKIDVQKNYMIVLRSFVIPGNTRKMFREIKTCPTEQILNQRKCCCQILLENFMCLLNCNVMHQNQLGVYKYLTSLKSLLEVLRPTLKLEKAKKDRFTVLVLSLAWKAIPIIYSREEQKLEGENVQEANMALSQVHSQMKRIQAEFGVIRLHTCPKIDVLEFLYFFCSHMVELQEYRPQQTEPLKSEIELFCVEFNLLRSLVSKTKQQKKTYEDEVLDPIIISLANDAIFVIHCYLAYGSDLHIKPSVSRIIEELEPVKMTLRSINVEKVQGSEEANRDGIEDEFMQISSSANPTSTVSPLVSVDREVHFVGFQDVLEKITDCLAYPSDEFCVVSIVGVPGNGKTTLAKKLYEDPFANQHFDIRAWCFVSQTYRKSDLWRTIVRQLNGNYDDPDDESVAQSIAQRLKKRRYLIVLDDTWEVQTWNDLKRYLPNDRNGSRVLITTRHRYVVEQITSDVNMHALRRFTENESMELLERKLDLNPSDFNDLLQIGHQIAQNFNGLPLAIALLAGHLLKVEKKAEKWKEIEKVLMSQTQNDIDRSVTAMLEWTFHQLPEHLKPCFLYAGFFSDYIPVWKLKLLWIAEGFVDNTKSVILGNRGFINDTKFEILEKQAEEYLMDLVSRNLLIPTRTGSLGRVKQCHMHELLSKFCLKISEQKDFMHWIEEDNPPIRYSVGETGQLDLWSRKYDFQNTRSFSSRHCFRSILHPSPSPWFTRCDASFIFGKQRLLQVLDIETCDIGVHIDSVKLLTHLRYLAVHISSESIPSSIASLWKLQTLIIRSEAVVLVPDSLWTMVNLRTIHITSAALFQVGRNRIEDSPYPNDIEILSIPLFHSAGDAYNILRRLPKLRKLSCVFCSNASESSYQFPVFDYLTQLVSLKILEESCQQRGTNVLYKFKFPMSLKMLTFSGFKIPWDEISNAGRQLPFLEVLKIKNNTCSGSWDVNDEDFPSIRHLEITWCSHIKEWFASEESFPKLEKLHLSSCDALDQIPYSLGDAPSLLCIEVISCNKYLIASARRIENQQKEGAQNTRFRVDIRK